MKTQLEANKIFKAKKPSKITCTKNEAYDIYKTSETFCFSNNGIDILERELALLKSNTKKGYYNADVAMSITMDKAIETLDNAIDLLKLTHIRAKELEHFAFSD